MPILVDREARCARSRHPCELNAGGGDERRERIRYRGRDRHRARLQIVSAVAKRGHEVACLVRPQIPRRAMTRRLPPREPQAPENLRRRHGDASKRRGRLQDEDR